MRFVITVFLIHISSSALWIVGFVFGVLFMATELRFLLWAASSAWTVQNILMLPAYLWTGLSLPGSISFPQTKPYDFTLLLGIRNGILSPYPSAPTIVWSVLLGAILTWSSCARHHKMSK
jgi:hypothetical protein